MAVLDNALQALFNMAHKDLLWENASPMSSFGSQKIEIDLKEVKSVEVFFAINNTSSSHSLAYSKALMDTGGRIMMSTTTNAYREFNVSKTGIQFNNTQRFLSYGGSAGKDESAYLIPLYIFAIRE